MKTNERPGVLQPKMLYEALADSIRERIFQRKLKPGEAIDEFRLVKDFGVSRTPVREALKVLASEGIIEMHSGRSCCVSLLAWQEVAQVFDILDSLEIFAIQRAAQSRTQLSEELAFDRHIAMAAGNEYLPQLIDRMVTMLRLAFGPAFDSEGMQPSESVRIDLRDAIAKGDVEQALSVFGQYSAYRRNAGLAIFGRNAPKPTSNAHKRQRPMAWLSLE